MRLLLRPWDDLRIYGTAEHATQSNGGRNGRRSFGSLAVNNRKREMASSAKR